MIRTLCVLAMFWNQDDELQRQQSIHMLYNSFGWGRAAIKKCPLYIKTSIFTLNLCVAVDANLWLR